MSAEIWVAIISGLCTLLGVVITVKNGNSKTLYRIEQLEKKQDKYNHLQERIAKRELHDAGADERIEEMRADIKDIKERIFKQK